MQARPHIGILGGGQLARMLALAAHPLNMKVSCYESNAQALSAKAVAHVFNAEYDDQESLQKFIEHVDVVTYEFENIPISSIKFIEQFRPVHPSSQVLRITQDRLYEKQLFQQLDIPTTQFSAVNSEQELTASLQQYSYPVILKARRFGYDGKAQYILKTRKDIITAWQALTKQAAIVEEYINFQYELSLIAVRNIQGKIIFYPLSKNLHQQGILQMTTAPFNNTSLQKQAEQFVAQLLEKLEYVGVLSVEFFCVNGNLLANEIAPRVHNSGHWTIEGAMTSQFENHIRAITELPLGSTQAKGYSALFNCIGKLPPLKQILSCPGTHYHDYNKSEHPGRKLAHISLNSMEKSTFDKRFKQLCRLFHCKEQ